jgi:transcriptional regulator with GAF, ATPase, and Fis domain
MQKRFQNQARIVLANYLKKCPLLVGATNRDLKAAAASRTFRQDLFYRFNVFPIEVPSLRDCLRDLATAASIFGLAFASCEAAIPNLKSFASDPRSFETKASNPGNVFQAACER